MGDDYEIKLEDQRGLYRQLGIKFDALTIHGKDFDVKMRGYDKEEVDGFLDDIIVDYERFYDIITDLLEKYKDLQYQYKEIERRQSYWEDEKKLLMAQQRNRVELSQTPQMAAPVTPTAANPDLFVERELVDENVKSLERTMEQMRLIIRKLSDI